MSHNSGFIYSKTNTKMFQPPEDNKALFNCCFKKKNGVAFFILNMLLQSKNFRLAYRHLARQNYSTSKAIDMSYDKYSMKPSSKPPVLICHGLFGSKQNWTSLAKAMSNRLLRDVYTIVRSHIILYSIYSNHVDDYLK